MPIEATAALPLPSLDPGLAVVLPDDTPDHLRRSFEDAADGAGRARSLFRIVNHVEFRSRRAAVRLAEAALTASLGAEDPGLVVEAQTLLAFQLNESNRSMEAYRHALEALAVASSIRENDLVAYLRAISTRAVIRATVGDSAGARRDYTAVLNAADPATDATVVLVARLNLSSMYVEAGQPRHALHHVSLAEEYLRTPGSDLPTTRVEYFRIAAAQNRADASIRLAEKLSAKGRTEQVPALLAAAESSCREIEELVGSDVFNQMMVQTIRASLCRLSGDISTGLTHGRAAVELAGELGQSVYPEPYIALAEALESTQAWPEAAEIWTVATAVCRQSGSSPALARAIDRLAKVHDKLGQTDVALRLTREALQLTLALMDRTNELAELDNEATALDGTAAGDETTWRERLMIAERQARIDPLTGILNRRGLAHAHTNPTEVVGKIVVLLDIDHFKLINDTYSHLVGDQVLREVAQILQDSAPPGALVARYGGEEFCLLFNQSTPENDHIVVGRFREVIADHHWQPPIGQITVSAGYSVLTDGVLGDALAAADAALYDAKKAGRNTIRPQLPSKKLPGPS